MKYDSKLFLKWILKLRSEYARKNKRAINIIPNTKENYIIISVKVVVDQYEQQYDLSKCKECKELYKNEIIETCKKCNSETYVKRKGNINDINDYGSKIY